MLSIEEEDEIRKTVALVMKHAGKPESQAASLSAALRVFYLRGHSDGYNDAMADAKAGKDQRTTVHLD